MRILVISDLPHFVTGGAEMQAMRLVEAWLDAGHRVVCLGRRMGPGPVAIGSHQVEVHRIHTVERFGRLGRAASYACSLAWLLLRHRSWADVVYTRFLGEAAATTALLKQMRLLKAPLVATPANTHGAGDTSYLKSVPFSAALVRLLDRRCDAINLIADGMVDDLRATGFTGHNFSHVPNGIPLRPMVAERTAGPIRFIAVGRLATQKGYDVLLRALARVRASLGETRIVIVGDGPERGRLSELATRLQLAKHIDWHGELAQERVIHELDAAHVFLLPSRYEGMSNAGLEAMSRGLPIIISACGGLDRHVHPGIGWVVPPEDEEALAGAIADALAATPERLDRMRVAARDCVEREFDMQVVASRYIALFRSLVEAPRMPKAYPAE